MIRPARKTDASEMVVLIDSAGYGAPLWVWSGLRTDEASVLEVGRKRAMREEGGFSYRNAFIAEENGAVQGMLVGYRLDDPYDVGDLDSVPKEFRQLIELEALAPGSWYVNVLAVHGEYRGQGLGEKLLAHAEQTAREAGARQMSVIFESGNKGAGRLYRRVGYAEKAHRPRVAYPGDYTGSKEWVLLVKDLGGEAS